MMNDRPANDLDLASSINAMAESTTAAELVRRQGQTKKVKVLSERKLMEWISTLMAQQLAGKEDSFSDAEKEELLKKTQEELALRIKREQALERERAAAQADLERSRGRDLRIVVRWSGTEPKLRLMVEARQAGLVEEALETLEAAAR